MHHTILAVCLLLLAGSAFGQSTVVTLSVTDTASQAWFNSTFEFQLVPNVQYPNLGGYTWTGGALQQSITGTLNGSAVATPSIPSNSAITPGGSTWKIKVCPAATTAQCYFSVPTIITGATQTVSLTPPAIFITLLNPPGPFTSAYSDAEIVNTPIGGQYFNLTSLTTRTCTAVTGTTCTTWVAGGGGSSSGSAASTFIIGNTPCGGASTCLQWVDDDSTDNCGAATTAFISSINAYTGKGIPSLQIWGSSTGKAYKLASCNIVFTNTQGVTVTGPATIDCAMALQSCLQAGVTATSGGAGSNASTLQSFAFSNLTIIGGHSLTGSGGNGSGVGAGIYAMPHTSAVMVDHVRFGGTGANLGFGVNSTFGTCSTYAIMIDAPMPDAIITNNVAAINSNGITSGACGFGNPAGAATGGSNTVMFENNIVFTDGEVSGAGQCGSIGINDGGTNGNMIGNNVFAFGIPILLTGNGHKISANQLDNTQCAAGGVAATIQVGGPTTVGPVTISQNVVQVDNGTFHATRMIDIKNGATPTLTGWTIRDNLNNGSVSLFPLIANTIACTPSSVTISCIESGNQNLQPNVSCASGAGGTPSGWQSGSMLGECYPAAQTANLGATNLLATGSIFGTPALQVSCEIILTRAATTSSTLPTCNVSFTDSTTGVASTVQITPAWAANTAGCTGTTTNTVGNSCTGTILINPNMASAFTYSTSNYASVGGTTMQYQPFITVFRADR